MSVLKYGIPALARLQCSNPVCRELAQWIVHTGNEGRIQILSCQEHLSSYTDRRPPGFRLEKLVTPGERNKVENEAPKEEQDEE